MVTNLGDYIDQHAPPPPQPKPPPPPRTWHNNVGGPFSNGHDGPGPFDILAELADWLELLPDGCEYVQPTDSETMLAIRRPGASSPVSAKVLKGNPHVIVVWSTEFYGLPTGGDQDITKGRLCALLHHGGDESAAGLAMLKGEATYLPTHLQEAVRGTKNDSPWAGFEGVISPDRIAGLINPPVDNPEPEPQGDASEAPEPPPQAPPPKGEPPIPAHIAIAISQIWAGVTAESAAQANGCTVEEVVQALVLPSARNIAPATEWDAADLLDLTFRHTPDILAGGIPAGLTLISAAPKVGKTRFLTQLSVAAVRGTVFINRVVTQTKVLSLSLEDGARRYQKSLRALVGTNGPARGDLRIRTQSKRLDEGGLAEIAEHLDRNPDCKLVIIDVLARVRPQGGKSRNAYQLDYEALAPLQLMANIRGISIVVVHHNNQRADVTDIFELVSGTSGLIGVVDSLMVLQRRRGDDVGQLHITGREVDDQTVALSFDENGWWGPAPDGMPPELLKESKEVRALWQWLAQTDGASTEQLASQYGRTVNTSQKLLHRLEELQLVDSLGKPSPGRPQCWQVVSQ